jgi:hypothetical protein
MRQLRTKNIEYIQLNEPLSCFNLMETITPYAKEDPRLKRSFNNHTDECSIKRIGRRIYLIGYFDYQKAGGFRAGEQNRINKYVIIFPSMIKLISFK